MEYSTLRIESAEPIAVVTLNRPAHRNSLNDLLIRELTDALYSLNRVPDIRVVLLTGNGPAFCAGMDLDYMQASIQKTHEENLEDARNLHRLLKTINQLKKVVVAVVNGPAVGGGCGLAAACDYVFIAKKKGRMGVPEVRLGFVPAIILHYLMKRMGCSRAREFVLQGATADSESCVALGLATGAVDDEKLLESASAFASRIASETSSSSIGLTKELLNRFDEMDIEHALDYADQLNALTRKTDDFRKGISSFLNKEELKW
jgi:methylglutaconyl-CoA hydratase